MTHLRILISPGDLSKNLEINYWGYWFDDIEIFNLIDNFALRYSELLPIVNVVRYGSVAPDDAEYEYYNSYSVMLPGARIATTNNTPAGIGSMLYYSVSDGGNRVYRRQLGYALYLEDFQDGQISDELHEYLSDRLTTLYDNSDFTLRNNLYNIIRFNKLDKRIWFKNPHRYPIRGNTSIWYNP